MVIFFANVLGATSRMPSSISASENMENPEQSRARKLSNNSHFGFSTKNWCLDAQYQGNIHVIITYRVFFHWYPPKKLKYGKPRLGESMLT